ncbi:Equilibrative nucleoside transporter 2 [Acipenser ruthenus]|uniref:Equilibrative nucleoside transporter 2 n=1 Tax=Acipenser ruthenus TaxID=7906 RepID=A0A444UYS5_ACIRT|nr:Equilibrative nucleoside transporter 2 [Acipenser ruthenus]
MDWAGRTVTSFVRWPRKESPLFPGLVCCRVVFIPLLMLCNVQERSYLPVLFSHDIVFALLMLLFSLSSGYCVCLSMSYAPHLLFILFFFILTAVLVKVPMEPGVFFSVTMATIWFINSFGAVLQGSLFGLVGLLPQKYSTLFMSGQGLAGTFAALAMLLALSSGTDSETAALGYFITPCVGTLVSVASYLLLPQLLSSLAMDSERSSICLSFTSRGFSFSALAI